MRTLFRVASIALLAFLFAVNVYRAATQAITHDEALTYSWFLSQPWDAVFHKYDANHHVLFTLLDRVIVALVGATPFTLRLPTLAACGLAFWTLFQLCQLLFGTGWLLLLSIAAVSLNPLLLDFLSAARGYGMALAFFLTAVYLLLKFLSEPGQSYAHRWRLLSIGLLFAASLCSNLTYLVPITAAILMSLGMHWLNLRTATPDPSVQLSVENAARILVTPFLVVSWLVLIFPLSAASGDRFYYGAHSWSEATESLVVYSLISLPKFELLPNTIWLREWSEAGMAIVLIGVVLLGFRSLFRWKHATAPERGLILLAGISAMSLGAIATGFYFAGVVLPVDRTAIYWVLLLTFAGLLIIRFTPGPRWISWLLAIPMLMVVAQYTLEFRTTYYAAWLLHRHFDQIVAYIEKDPARPSNRPVVVAGSREMAVPLNFYKQSRKLAWLAETPGGDMPKVADYWTFGVLQRDEVQKRGLRIVWSDPLSGTVLAVPMKRTADTPWAAIDDGPR